MITILDYDHSEYGLSLVYLNIIVYVYLLFLFFSLILIFDIKNFLTLNEFKKFSSLQFFSVTIILTLFSLAGLPPFMGFVSKFLMFFFLIFKQGFFFLFFFTVINIFIIYFYIQNVRFLFSTGSQNPFFFKNHRVYLNFNLILYVVVLNFFNFFGVFFLEDLLLFIDNICQYNNFY